MQIILTRMAMGTAIFLKERPAWILEFRSSKYATPKQVSGGKLKYLCAIPTLSPQQESNLTILSRKVSIRSWMPASVTLEDQINIGGGMERHTYGQ